MRYVTRSLITAWQAREVIESPLHTRIVPVLVAACPIREHECCPIFVVLGCCCHQCCVLVSPLPVTSRHLTCAQDQKGLATPPVLLFCISPGYVPACCYCWEPSADLPPLNSLPMGTPHWQNCIANQNSRWVHLDDDQVSDMDMVTVQVHAIYFAALPQHHFLSEPAAPLES